jgi:hypothetical protein
VGDVGIGVDAFVPSVVWVKEGISGEVRDDEAAAVIGVSDGDNRSGQISE